MKQKYFLLFFRYIDSDMYIIFHSCVDERVLRKESRPFRLKYCGAYTHIKALYTYSSMTPEVASFSGFFDYNDRKKVHRSINNKQFTQFIANKHTLLWIESFHFCDLNEIVNLICVLPSLYFSNIVHYSTNNVVQIILYFSMKFPALQPWTQLLLSNKFLFDISDLP